MKKAGKSVKKSVKKQFEDVKEKTQDLGQKGKKIIFNDSDSVTCELIVFLRYKIYKRFL